MIKPVGMTNALAAWRRAQTVPIKDSIAEIAQLKPTLERQLEAQARAIKSMSKIPSNSIELYSASSIVREPLLPKFLP